MLVVNLGGGYEHVFGNPLLRVVQLNILSADYLAVQTAGASGANRLLFSCIRYNSNEKEPTHGMATSSQA